MAGAFVIEAIFVQSKLETGLLVNGDEFINLGGMPDNEFAWENCSPLSH